MEEIIPRTVLITSLLAITPVSELRGAIPYALASGIPLWLTYLLCVGLNALVGPLVILFLNTLHRLFQHWLFYRNLFEKFVIRARKRVGPKVEKYGALGIMLFVAIPLPITGAWTGTLGAWILGLSRRKTYLAVLGGVILSGLIVTLVVSLGIQALSFFVKHLG